MVRLEPEAEQGRLRRLDAQRERERAWWTLLIVPPPASASLKRLTTRVETTLNKIISKIYEPE